MRPNSRACGVIMPFCRINSASSVKIPNRKEVRFKYTFILVYTLNTHCLHSSVWATHCQATVCVFMCSTACSSLPVYLCSSVYVLSSCFSRFLSLTFSRTCTRCLFNDVTLEDFENALEKSLCPKDDCRPHVLDTKTKCQKKKKNYSITSLQKDSSRASS